jgi:hypothetical protein
MTHHTVRLTVRRIAVAAVCAIALSSCGVPTGSEVHTIDSDDVLPTATTQQQDDQPTSVSVGPQIFLADTEDVLVPTPFRTERLTTSDILQDVLDQLTVGPTTAQTEQGLSSFIPPTLTMTVEEVSAGKASITLGGDLPNTNQTTATAQIVLSATSVLGISSVLLKLGERPVEAPLPDGSLTDAPLTAEHYKNLISPTPG